MRPCKTLIAVALLAPGRAAAHATEGGFVLLLPTDLYIAGGGIVVALTVLLLALAPRWRPDTLLRPLVPLPHAPAWAPALTRYIALVLLIALLWQGAFGPTDPLRNPLTLGLWTLFWIVIVSVQALLFDIWRWLNPLAALADVFRLSGIKPAFARKRPSRWIAVGLFLAFSGFLLADPAPSDPRRLAVFASLYVAFTALGIALYGPRWLTRAEFLTFLMRTYRRTAIAGPGRAGPNGWRILRLGPPAPATATFMLLLLGSGSFDGLNETFWWLGVLGVNPLEFPGRSAVVGPTLAGLLTVNALLILAYGLAIRAGLALARSDLAFTTAFRIFAPSILPIAAGYHVAHYLTAFLIDGQHLVSLFSTMIGAGERHVTTGFLNRLDTVRIIWLAQAGAVVIGHVLAILVAHALALRAIPDPRRATLSQLPLALFMVGYTIFGLWLLAAPKGA